MKESGSSQTVRRERTEGDRETVIPTLITAVFSFPHVAFQVAAEGAY